MYHSIIIYDGPYKRMHNNKNEKKIEKYANVGILFSKKDTNAFCYIYKHTFDLSDCVTIQACPPSSHRS